MNYLRVTPKTTPVQIRNIPSGSLDLHSLLEEFLFDRRIQDCSPHTVRDYRDELTSFIGFLMSQDCSRADEVTPFHVRSFLAHLQDLGRAPTTVNRGFGNIRAFFNWMVQEDYLALSPCAKIKAPKVPQIIKPLISQEQFEGILSQCPANTYTGARRRAMYFFLRHSGVRVAELASLRMDDLDWDRRRAKVYGKGAKERYVPFIPEVQRALRRYRRYLVTPAQELWLGRGGRPMTRESVQKDLSVMFRRAGLAGTLKDACHIFRRTFAMQLLEDGLDVMFVQQIMGHSTLEVLRKHYLTKLDSEKALAAMDRLYGTGGV